MSGSKIIRCVVFAAIGATFLTEHVAAFILFVTALPVALCQPTRRSHQLELDALRWYVRLVSAPYVSATKF